MCAAQFEPVGPKEQHAYQQSHVKSSGSILYLTILQIKLSAREAACNSAKLEKNATSMDVKLQLVFSKEAEECQAIVDWVLSLTAITKWTFLKNAGNVKRTRERVYHMWSWLRWLTEYPTGWKYAWWWTEMLSCGELGVSSTLRKWKLKVLWLLYPKDRGTVFLQNSGNYLPSDCITLKKKLSLQKHCWENLKFCMKSRLH